MAKKKTSGTNSGSVLFDNEPEASNAPDTSTENQKQGNFLSGLGRAERIAVVGVCLLLVVGALGATGLGGKIGAVFTSRILNQKTSQSQLAQNALTASSLNPATTTQLSKEYIYAGSRMLAIEDAGAAGATSRVNVALASNGAQATASSTTTDLSPWSFLPSSTNDGDRKGVNGVQNGFWRDGTSNIFPDWLQIAFNGAKTIDEIDVFTVQDDDEHPIEPTEEMPFTMHGNTAFNIKYWNGGGWTPVPGASVSGNNKVWRKFTFAPVTTDKIIVEITGAVDDRSRIVEVEAYQSSSVAPPPRINVALASYGATADASTTTTDLYPSSFLPSSANNGDRKGLNWEQNGGWRDDTNGFPDWLRIDFHGAKTIDEIDVFTLQDNVGNPIEPTEEMPFSMYGITNFDVQYQSGADWIPVPNGNVMNNNKVWRKFTFAPVTTDKIRVLVNYALNNRSRIVEVEAYQSGSTPMPTPTPRINFALASNGATASASTTTTDLAGLSFPASSTNNGDNWGRNWGQNGGWRDGTPDVFPDSLEIAFTGQKSINEIDIFSVQDDPDNPVEPTEAMTFSLYGITNFDVQYQSGADWIPVPGASVSGNNKVWRKFTFAPVTTDKIRVLVNYALYSRSRIVEVEAWGGGTGQ